MNFLHPDNDAGKQLCIITARANAIIAEMLRLSEHIPQDFLYVAPPPLDAKLQARLAKGKASAAEKKMVSERPAPSKYSKVVFDLSYFKDPEKYDEGVDNDGDLVDLDEEFRENNLAILERFYKLFESIHRYVTELQAYLEKLNDGRFIHHTLESCLLDVEGRQLVAESVYLYGVILLLMDLRIPGLARERMIVSHYRYKGSASVSGVDHVVRLCRNTGFVAGGRRPDNYPEQYFARFKVPDYVVEMITARLRADDIYNLTQSFPSPAHRSTALATQAAMLYVILYFQPKILYSKPSIMREIVDKNFPDNWVIPFYMGFTVDLSQAWRYYPAALAALKNVLTKENIHDVVESHQSALRSLHGSLARLLTKGVLTDEYVLEHTNKMLQQSRACNHTLRWCVLHRTTSLPGFREHICKELPMLSVLKLMMQTAQFEFKVKSVLRGIFDSKETVWDTCKKECSERMVELASYYSGEKELSRQKKNATLQGWFTKLGEEIKALDSATPLVSGRKIGVLMNALEEVEEFNEIDTNLQVKQFLSDTRDELKKMMKTANVTDRIVGSLDIISDFSYAKDILDSYVGLMHDKIRENPNVCLLLRATFLKLSSILSLPLVRITQCESKDDVSVANYYSSQLVAYVRKVLEIIPISVFRLLATIIKMQTTTLKQLPTKVERKFLKDYAQLDQRYELAKSTHQVSVFTEGILAMKTTLLGIIKMDPKQLLEDGIRKQLVFQVASALDRHLVFPQSGGVGEFEKRLNALGVKLDGYRLSFQYIQDYIGVYGLRIWQEEVSRIINYFIEAECNTFLKKKVYDWQSAYQSDAIPIPKLANDNPQARSVTFMGRIVRELLHQTHPTRTVYLDTRQGWYDFQMREVVGIRTMSLLQRAMGVIGLHGIDKLICFMIVRDLKTFLRMYRRTVSGAALERVNRRGKKEKKKNASGGTTTLSTFCQKLAQELHPTTTFPPNTQQVYALAQSKTANLWPFFVEYINKVGQAQLLRRQIANELNFASRLDSHVLNCSLEVMNKALVNDVKMHYNRPDEKTYPGNRILAETSKFLEASGINDPLTKIYLTSEPLEGVPLLMFLFVLSEISKLRWHPTLATLVNQEKGTCLDGAPLVVGVITLLKQFHSSHTHTFLAYLGQYVRANISCGVLPTDKKEAAKIAKGQATLSLPPQVCSVLLFLEEFCRFSKMSRQAIAALVPSYVFDRFDRERDFKNAQTQGKKKS